MTVTAAKITGAAIKLAEIMSELDAASLEELHDTCDGNAELLECAAQFGISADELEANNWEIANRIGDFANRIRSPIVGGGYDQDVMGQHLWGEIAARLSKLPAELRAGERVEVTVADSHWTATIRDLDTEYVYRVTFERVT